MYRCIPVIHHFSLVLLKISIVLVLSSTSLQAANLKLKGEVENFTNGRFTVNDTIVCYDDDSLFKFLGNAAAIKNGDYVEVKADRVKSCVGFGGVYANEIKVKESAEGGLVYSAVNGGGVKGPMALAGVAAYLFDGASANFQGAVAGVGSTDEAAQIVALALAQPLQNIYILEFSSQETTYDLTTGITPVITVMRTIMTEEMVNTDAQIYATPLTTLATDLAIFLAIAGVDTNGDGVINGSESVNSTDFIVALAAAQDTIKSVFGFGLDANIDIFSTPPLLDSSTGTAEEQQQATDYRTAVEAVTAIIYQMSELSGSIDTNAVLSDLVADLSDGIIDGLPASEVSYSTQSLEVLDQDPNTLPIPNAFTDDGTPLTVAEVSTIVAEETAVTLELSETEISDLEDTLTTSELVDVEPDPDLDDDGVLNVDDLFPENPNESSDSDGDGIGDNADPDDDNDGILDVDEGVVPNPIPGTDEDGDSVLNPDDNCLNTFNPAQTNTDGDLEGDACDSDDDNDGVPDVTDAFPFDASESVDTDGDGIGNVADTDDDNDGLSDIEEGTGDPDSDGIPNNLDTDSDGDGVDDDKDKWPTDPSQALDTDGDSVSNTLDNCPITANGDQSDTDGDLVGDVCDAFPSDPNESVDTDGDGVGDNGDEFPSDATESADGDGDGVGDNADAFPSNPLEWVDTDGNGVGDNTDNDDDGDGVEDGLDAFPLDPTETSDIDGDGVGDNTDADDDNDGVNDIVDNCPAVANADQADVNSNGIGNLCDITIWDQSTWDESVWE
jgi:hypothetical protein